MDEMNTLGPVVEQVDRVVGDNLQRGGSTQDIAQQITALLSQHFAKWNWTVLCGDQYEVISQGRKHGDVMLCKRYPNGLRVVVVRGSPLDSYQGGPASISILRNKLPSGQADEDAIRAAIEGSGGDTGRMSSLIRNYLKENYPRENWAVIAGDDFALSQDYEQISSLMYCATVGHISIVVVKAASVALQPGG